MPSDPQPTVGQSPVRPDGLGKVTGRTAYVDDLPVEGLWYGATVRSPHAAARVRNIDIAPALADPDVVVVTAGDLPGPNILKLIAEDWPVLAAGRVNHVAEPVALVAAPTPARARAAAAAVRVDYDPSPAILNLDDALRSEATVLAACNIERGDVAGGLAAADHVIEGEYETGHQEHVYIEPQGMLAIPHEGGALLEVIGSLQCPYYLQKALEHVFGQTARIRVRQAATGGGFGGKEDYPDMIGAHAALLARKCGHPVKIVYDRHEDMVATTKRHPSRVRHRTGVTSDGKLLAMEIEVLLDGGAYTTLSPVVLSRAVIHAGGAYACPNVSIHGRALATNTATNGAFRGFGAPQTQFAVERHMDRIARSVGLDPLTLRERNAYQPGDVTPTGQVLKTSVSALDCLRQAEQRTNFRARWNQLEKARRQAWSDRPWQGIGLSLCWHGAGFTGNGERLMRSPVKLALAPGGIVEVLVSSTDFGQGTTIVLAQIVADAVGIPVERVRVVEADTGVVPDSGPTVASRTVMIVGSVLEHAGERLMRELCQHAELSRAQVLASFVRVADERLAAGPLEVVEHHEPDASSTFDEATYRGDAYAVYGWGANVVEVEVDPDSLATRPVKATLICDVGKAIHPVLCAGQVEGGTLQALGWGYLEEIKMENGRYLNDTLSTYVIPTTLDTPDMDTVLLENPSPVGPQGAKGVGEIPMDGGAPAIVAAIENATGVVCSRAPATPEALLACIERGATLDGAPQFAEGTP